MQISEETMICMETKSQTVSDCLRSINDIFMHVIRFDELEPSISNENGARVRLWQ